LDDKLEPVISVTEDAFGVNKQQFMLTVSPHVLSCKGR
jgi:hypothetical protein